MYQLEEQRKGGPGPPGAQVGVGAACRARGRRCARRAERRREACGRAGLRAPSVYVRVRAPAARWSAGRAAPGRVSRHQSQPPARPGAREAGGQGEPFRRGRPRRAHTHTPPRGSAGSAAARGAGRGRAGRGPRARRCPALGGRLQPPRGTARSSPPRGGRRRGAGAAALGGLRPRTLARTWIRREESAGRRRRRRREGGERKTGVPAAAAAAVRATRRPAATFLEKDHTCVYSSLWKRDVGIEALRMVDSSEKRSVIVFPEQPKALEVEMPDCGLRSSFTGQPIPLMYRSIVIGCLHCQKMLRTEPKRIFRVDSKLRNCPGSQGFPVDWLREDHLT
ncbi:uncharacterized protein LOC132359875 [Balaenoptera ricei]|uniref:uncharacterized protein LOC132359875 n=1 Tax=Balaenoptera ricei TaxID=2746895 RepID=UPI0028BE17D4|nr:uncharacterized protein LOC132359875 [Balaenoptera ricei]